MNNMRHHPGQELADFIVQLKIAMQQRLYADVEQYASMYVKKHGLSYSDEITDLYFASLMHQQKLKPAIEVCQRLFGRRKTDIRYLNNFARLHHLLKNYDQAISLSRLSLDLSLNEDALFNLAQIYFTQGERAASRLHYQQLIAINPNHLDGLNNLGILFEEDDPGKSMEFYRKALKVNSDYFNANINLGKLLLKNKAYNDALVLLSKAYQANLRDYNAVFNLALCNMEMHQFHDAVKLYSSLLDRFPDDEKIYTNLGKCYAEMGNITKARTIYHQGLEKAEGQHLLINYNLGNLEHQARHFETALVCYQKVLKLEPDHVKALNNISNSAREIGNNDLAIEALNKLISIEKDNHDALWNLALSKLCQENFEAGWALYEHRWKSGSCDSKHLVDDMPLWDGTAGKKVLLWKEQGIGDEVMFLSALKSVLEIAKEVCLICDLRLQPIIKRSFAKYDNLRVDMPSKINQYKHYDAHSPVGSLFRLFRPNRKAFLRHRQPYFKADPNRVSKYAERLDGEKTIKIGISWNSTNKKRGFGKSCPLDLIMRPFKGKSVQFINLQYGLAQDDHNELSVKYGGQLTHFSDVDLTNDMDDVCAMIDACDVVVTISNTVAHLAGALGKTTYLMLYKTPEWRWGKNDLDCYLYPNVTKLIQHRQDDWSGPIADLQEAFKKDGLF